MNLVQKCLLFSMVGFNSEIFVSSLRILPLKIVAKLMDHSVHM